MSKFYLVTTVKQLFFSTVCCIAVSASFLTNATIVEFQTSQGNIQVNLFDKSTPKTVANFLKYVNDGHYTNSVIHRVVDNFIVQGGGFEFAGDWPLTRLPTTPAVLNEPLYSNVKGTIAMAKLGGSVNSATDQWFFNLTDNSANLDVQNGGFTVFGQVIGDGMMVVDKIAKLSRCQDIPMINYSTQNCSDQTTPGVENFVIINQIMLFDTSEQTDANLTKVKNTLLNKPVDTPKTPSTSGGGTFAWLLLFLLPLCVLRLGKRK